jgi:hypothetical protein
MLGMVHGHNTDTRHPGTTHTMTTPCPHRATLTVRTPLATAPRGLQVRQPCDRRHAEASGKRLRPHARRRAGCHRMKGSHVMRTGAACASKRRSPLCTQAMSRRHGSEFSLDTQQLPPYSQAHTLIRASAERRRGPQAAWSGDSRCGQPDRCPPERCEHAREGAGTAPATSGRSQAGEGVHPQAHLGHAGEMGRTQRWAPSTPQLPKLTPTARSWP